MSDYSNIAVIADTETIRGFMIAGVVNDPEMPTILEVKRNTPAEELSRLFLQQTQRRDIAILMICDFASQKISSEIAKYNGFVPSVLIIPSKNKRLN